MSVPSAAFLAIRAETAQARADRGRLGAFLAPCRIITWGMTKRPENMDKANRYRRLGAALRENLKRRRAQAKGRSDAQARPDPSHDSAGIAADKRKS
jgi:hypothetical protein